MSGGVDSSVSAARLLEQGYDVVGVTMRLWTAEREAAPLHQRRCCAVEDIGDARAVCDQLGVPHYVINYERSFGRDVVDYFVREYSLGRTPNPCLACNQHIKFGPLLEQALALDAQFLATGHYAQVRCDMESYQLWRAADLSKDQSYVLYTLGQHELSRTIFPIGSLKKADVRQMARDLDLPTSDKPDSVDICFIPDGNYRTFVAERVGKSEGDIIDRAGNRLGQHEGVTNYTVGQRRGLPARGGDGPLYVVEIDAGSSTVIVGPEEALMANGVVVEEVTFVSGHTPVDEIEVEAKIRYRSPTVPSRLLPRGEGAEVHFYKPQRGPSPGQSVVLYRGEQVLGGGMVKAVL